MSLMHFITPLSVVSAQLSPVSYPAYHVTPVEEYFISSEFGYRIHPIHGTRRMHKGIDLAAPTGTLVYATADGIVSKAHRWGSYGKIIEIEHVSTVHTRYAHLSDYAVSEGDEVKKGQLIGFIGSTGGATGPHLHYEIRFFGEAIDPYNYIK